MNKTPHILVVDDEKAIADLVAELMVREGMAATACYGGADALELFSHADFDLVILDLMMPGIDGLEVCRRLRTVSQVPICFLSAKDEEVDKVVGLTMGADDYISKPFKPRELVARVRSMLRRASYSGAAAPRAEGLSACGIDIDENGHHASLLGVPLQLTPKEFDILATLVRAQGSPVSARELYETVWEEPYIASSSNSVMVHIRHLRAKLAAVDSSQDYIVTMWGVGYRINLPAGAGA
ncbi:MAG: response regulator transcription factor [Coriobacteriaceae bacterium]|nr:response regulator transcription factor [Coriobacteriaceae bacterium]